MITKRPAKKPFVEPKQKRTSKRNPPQPVEVKYPMRINKYLALKNHATRRGADELISQRKVFLNGKMARLGDHVSASDKVEVRFHSAPQYVYYAFNKPVGMVTHAETGKEKDIVDSLPKALQALKVFPVGRLDRDSHGLILLTNDGRVTDRLLNPQYSHEKMYQVTTKLPLRANFKEKMENGVNIEGYITKKCKVEILGSKRFMITLTEGKTHQIRRMCVALFNEVVDLKRVSVMNVELNNTPSGAARPIVGAELSTLLKSLALI